jgi:protein gp37
VPEKLFEPFHWNAPRLVFVNSMSDLFHDQVPDAYIEAVAKVMSGANWHTYQVLTKRSERLLELSGSVLATVAQARHVWWGVSVEDRKYGLPRIEHLRRASLGMRFLSIEPLLEDLGDFSLEGIDWVIVGGESGRGARRMREEWVLSIRDRCASARVPFFFKQWGGVRKSEAGRHLRGRTYDQMPALLRGKMPGPRERTLAARQLQTNSFSPKSDFGALAIEGLRRDTA